MTTETPTAASEPLAALHPQNGWQDLARRFVWGRPGEPRWVRPALFGLLAATALLYLWDLSASGWANALARSGSTIFVGNASDLQVVDVSAPQAALRRPNSFTETPLHAFQPMLRPKLPDRPFSGRTDSTDS